MDNRARRFEALYSYDPTKKDLQTCFGRRREELGDVTFMLYIKI